MFRMERVNVVESKLNMNANDRLISEMGKEDFMRFVRREILNFQDKTTKKVYVKNFSWFVRGFAIGRGWKFTTSDYDFMELPFP